MSFELQPDQSLRANLRRVARHQMENALNELTGAEGDSRDEVVHEVRKSFKKLRALLRLVRPMIAARTYRQENSCFRDAARPLTRVRDAKILIEALDKLTEHFKEHVAERSFGAIRKALGTNLRAVRKQVLEEQNAFAVTTNTLREAQERIEAWADVPDRWRAVGRGLAGVYRRAGDAFADAAADPTVERLHEWRKQAKYLRYQLEVLRPLWPERIEELVHETDRMGELLGDDHDLAILRQAVTDDPDRFGGDSEREVLLALIDRRRDELEQEARLLGTRFFVDKPKAFARRLKGYWKTWRSHTESAESNAPQPAPV